MRQPKRTIRDAEAKSTQEPSADSTITSQMEKALVEETTYIPQETTTKSVEEAKQRVSS